MNIKHDGDLPCSNGFNVKVVSSNVEHFQSIISRLWSQRHPKAKGIQVLPCGEKELDLWRTGGVPDTSSDYLIMNFLINLYQTKETTNNKQSHSDLSCTLCSINL